MGVAPSNLVEDTAALHRRRGDRDRGPCRCGVQQCGKRLEIPADHEQNRFFVLVLKACLEKNGMTPPSGGAAAGGSAGTPGSVPAAGNSTFQKALKACASLRPKGASGTHGGFGAGGTNSAALAAYRNCLTLHGVALPGGPSASGATGSTGTTLPSARDTSNPTVKAALNACASLRPSGTSGTGSSSSTTTTS